MSKDLLALILFFGPLMALHYFLMPSLPAINPSKDFFLIYTCLITVNLMGITLFYLQKKMELLNFSAMFLVFTTIQLLACMSFALGIKVLREDDAKITLIHFVAAFFIALFAQSFYFIRQNNK